MAADLEQRFDAFVNEERDRALRIAWRLLGGDAAAAEDVAQEAFVRAYRGLAGFRGEAELATWFRRILVNLLDNAVKYGPEGGVVTVRVARCEGGVSTRR